MLLTLDLMANRFSKNKTKSDLEISMKRLTNEGFNLFSFTNGYLLESVPAYLLLRRKHQDFLIEYLDKNQLNWQTSLLKTQNISLLSMAVLADNIEFLAEWHARKLPWVIQPCDSHPVADALFLGKTKVVSFFIENKIVSWEDVVPLHYKVEDTRNNKVFWKKIKTTAYALALSSGRADLVSLCFKTLSLESVDLELKVPDPSLYSRSAFPKINLNISLGHFILAAADKAYNNSYNASWWLSIKDLFMGVFKTSSYGDLFDWTIFNQPTECPESLYRGLSSLFEKPVNESSQKRLLASFMSVIKNPYRKTHIKAYSSGKRLEDLWTDKGVLGNLPKKTFVSVGVVPMNKPLCFAGAGNMPYGVASAPVYAAVVLHFIRQPSLWRAGLSDSVLVKQFWELISFLPTASENYPQASWMGQSWTAISSPLFKLTPDFFGEKPRAFGRETKDKSALWKSLDLISKHSRPDMISKALMDFIKTRNFGTRNKHGDYTKRNPVCILGLSYVFEWAVARQWIEAADFIRELNIIMSENIDFITELDASLAFNAFKSRVENYNLKRKVNLVNLESIIPVAL